MEFKQKRDDKRNSVRLDFTLPVRISWGESRRVLQGVLVNLSIHGMLIALAEDDAAGDVSLPGNCMVRIIFPGRASRLIIDELRTSVVRLEDRMLALEFEEPLEWFLLFTVYRGKQLRE